MENNTIPTTVRRLLIFTVALLVITLLASGANVYFTMAAPQRAVTVPSTVGFEGRLADSSGNPVADGSHTVTFSLYGQATGVTALWTEGQTVTTHSGLYSTQLGMVTPLQPSTFDGPRWLGVKVGTETEMTPRIPISSVPFALNAQEAAHAEDAAGLQGRSVAASTPTNGQALLWDASGNQWLPGTIEVPNSIEYPRHASGFHMNSEVVTGSGIHNDLYPQQLFSILSYQSPPANGDTFTTSFLLREGTYTLSLLGVTAYNRGKIDWYVDNVLQISGQDWYSSSVTWNIVKPDNITVVSDGYHVLKGIVNGKNVGSTGYFMILTSWSISPASD